MSQLTAESSWARHLRCSVSADTAPLKQLATLSPEGAPWLVSYELDKAKGRHLRAALSTRPWSLWRYQELLPLTDFAARIDLGEGATPLFSLRAGAPAGVEVLIKQEGGNPTGSFKDRGLSLAVNRARELGAVGVELASAGNAALALAAYAAAGGLAARVALPVCTPAEVERRCRLLGAEVLCDGANLVQSAALLAAEPSGYFGVSTFREPYRVEGKKTLGLEIAEQLDWRLPDWLVYPTGGGTGVVGMAKAFDELEQLGLIGPQRPRWAVVQMAGCAPLVRAFDAGAERAEPWQDPDTLVWGLRVPKSLADFMILKTLAKSDGVALAMDENKLDEAQHRLARDCGLIFGPEGAACMMAVEELARRGEIRRGQRVVVFQTGNPSSYGD